MHSFEVHLNESACRKKVRLGLEQVRCPLHWRQLLRTSQSLGLALPLQLEKHQDHLVQNLIMFIHTMGVD